MERIASFNVDHTRLRPGLYVSRRDSYRGATVTTFDLRVTAPNVENVMGTGAAHTLEHIVATWLRNSARKDEVVYFGPMGCRTGFYLLMFGDQTPESVLPLVREAFAYAAGFEGDVRERRPRSAATGRTRTCRPRGRSRGNTLRRWKTRSRDIPKIRTNEKRRDFRRVFL